MTTKYQIQELIEQTPTRTVHRVRKGGGVYLRLTRLFLDSDDRKRLRQSPMLADALEELQALRHPSLCEVLNCGLDEEGIPWVIAPWEDGVSLEESHLKEADIKTVSEQAKCLLEDFGPVAGAVSFDPVDILLVGEERDSCLFTIDYFRWFSEIAVGVGPGGHADGKAEVRKLLANLGIRQLRLPKKVSEKAPIPFVDDRSPALIKFETPRDPWLGGFMFWGTLLVSVLLISWLTVEGMKRAEENPRREKVRQEMK